MSARACVHCDPLHHCGHRRAASECISGGVLCSCSAIACGDCPYFGAEGEVCQTFGGFPTGMDADELSKTHRLNAGWYDDQALQTPCACEKVPEDSSGGESGGESGTSGASDSTALVVGIGGVLAAVSLALLWLQRTRAGGGSSKPSPETPPQPGAATSKRPVQLAAGKKHHGLILYSSGDSTRPSSAPCETSTPPLA